MPRPYCRARATPSCSSPARCQPSCLRISCGSGGGLCKAISCLSHWRTCSLSGLPGWYMADSLRMLKLRSSGFNIGLANAEPFAQYHAGGKPVLPCLAKATVLRTIECVPPELARRPPEQAPGLPWHAMHAANGQLTRHCVFRLSIKEDMALSAWQEFVGTVRRHTTAAA